MTKLKYQLATVATAALVGNAYAQPVVPDETNAPPPQQPTQCPAPQGAAAGEATPPQCPAPQTAQAEPQPLQQPTAYPPPPSQPTVVEEEKPWWDHQFAISVGGGVEDFARSGPQGMTGTGGSWNARLTVGVHSYLAGEASYIGSAQTLKLDNNPTLYGNGAQGALRINILPHLDVTPFAFGGVAWRHYSQSSGTSNMDKLEVPVGGGIAAYVADMMFDVRGEYRFSSSESASGTGVDALSGSFDRWGVTGNVGAVF